jgi:hypothetical protein
VGDIYTVTTDTGKSFAVTSRLDTGVELNYYANGTAFHLLSNACCLLPVACCLLSAVSYLMPVVSHLVYTGGILHTVIRKLLK